MSAPPQLLDLYRAAAVTEREKGTCASSPSDWKP